MYLGIMLNELITNSIKYASKEGLPLSIRLSRSKTEDGYELIYRDSGDGIPSGVFEKKRKSLGIYLVNAMARQLNGKLEYEGAPHWQYPMWFTPEPEWN